MRVLLAVILLAASACGDDAASNEAADLSAAGCYLSETPPCCPGQDPLSGLPRPGAACSPVGSVCAPGPTDIRCTCESGGWSCVGTLAYDMSFPSD